LIYFGKQKITSLILIKIHTVATRRSIIISKQQMRRIQIQNV
jgi:hypothetical protein